MPHPFHAGEEMPRSGEEMPRSFTAVATTSLPHLQKRGKDTKLALKDFVGHGVEALAGSWATVPAKASTPRYSTTPILGEGLAPA